MSIRERKPETVERRSWLYDRRKTMNKVYERLQRKNPWAIKQYTEELEEVNEKYDIIRKGE